MTVIVAALCWSWRETEVHPLPGAVGPARRDGGPSRSELAALEHALRLAERWDAQVVAATVGPAEADAMLRDALAAGAAQGLRVEPAGWTAGPRPAGLVGGEQESAAALAAALRQHYGVPDLVLCGDRAADRATGSFPAFLAAFLSAARAPPRGGRPRGGADGAPARRGVGRGGRRTPAEGRAARHAGQQERRDYGGPHAGGRRGAADPGARASSVPAAAARASRSVRHRAAPDLGADRRAGAAHPADRCRPAAAGPGRQRAAGVPAPAWLPPRGLPGSRARL